MKKGINILLLQNMMPQQPERSMRGAASGIVVLDHTRDLDIYRTFYRRHSGPKYLAQTEIPHRDARATLPPQREKQMQLRCVRFRARARRSHLIVLVA